MNTEKVMVWLRGAETEFAIPVITVPRKGDLIQVNRDIRRPNQMFLYVSKVIHVATIFDDPDDEEKCTANIVVFVEDADSASFR